MAKNKKASGSHLVMIIPDVHFPIENKQAVEVTKTALAILKPTRTVFLGDMLDCGMFSTHGAKTLKELRQSNFIEEEVKPGNSFIDFAQKYTKHETAFVEGNHELRLTRWAIDHGAGAQSLYNSISPEYLLSKGRSNFKYIPYLQNNAPILPYYPITKNLIAVHGWSASRHSAAFHLDRAKSVSVVYGHVHRQQMDSYRDPFTKERRVAFSVGCLSELQPIYMHSPSAWIWGFGLVWISQSNPKEWTEYVCNITDKGRVILPDGSEVQV